MSLPKRIAKKVYRFVDIHLPFTRKYIRSYYFNRKEKLYNSRYSHEVNEKKIVFIAFAGRNYTCTPMAVYEYLQSDERFSDWEFVWAFKEPDDFEWLTEKPNTSVVKYASSECWENMSTAKYWISNNRIPIYVYPREEQIYVQCWHGTPLKRLGYDLEDTVDVRNTINELLGKYDIDMQKITWFLSPSTFASNCFTSAFNLKKNGKEDAILEIGYPRNDSLSTYSEADRKAILSKLGIPADTKKKIIMYAPTYRENQYNLSSGYSYDLNLDFKKLREQLGEDYIILFRVHYYVSNAFDFGGFEDYIIDCSDYTDINHLYIAADLLITDYSSVFFDYANTKRPMLFYMYDLEEYRDVARGFYLDLDELPGDIVRTEDELAESIINSLDEEKYKKKYGEKYTTFSSKYNYLDDGNAAKRFVEEVFVNKE